MAAATQRPEGCFYKLGNALSHTKTHGKLIGEQGYAEMGYRAPEVGVGVATWVIRRANLMWRNLEHVTGAYSEHAKTKREAVHAAPQRVGRRAPCNRDAPCERRQPQA